MNPLSHEVFAELDRHFARFIQKFGGDETKVSLAAAALSRSVREGNICWPIDRMPTGLLDEDKEKSFKWPSPKQWRLALADSRAIGGPDDNRPLVLDQADRLYLRRYWDYQERLGRALREMVAENRAKDSDKRGTQDEAIAFAMANRLTIISGGPGTGKTTTVLKILKQVLEQSENERLRIALATPTGKAAARLEHTIRTAIDRLDCSAETRERIPRTASTIHRLLGSRTNSVYFRHDERNPLPIDLLVIDEASMVALPLLCKLFDALPPHCRVILLGDHEQLASVEPGAVLADMVEAAATAGSPLANAVVTLTKNYRFGLKSGVHHLCSAIRKGNAPEAIRILRAGAHADLVSHEVQDAAALSASLSKVVLAGFSDFTTETKPELAIAKLETFRVLTALRRGRFGVEWLNREIERILFEAGLIPESTSAGYPGRPVLITQNDHQLQLYNGDVGVLLPDPVATETLKQLWAWFAGRDNVPRRFAPARLPQHETAYAMTVHKSQGSEFERVLFILPDADSPVLTRELIYTGLTRARSQVECWWNEPVFAAAIDRRADRSSGLRDLLSGPKKKNAPPRQEQLSLF
jgi:exodeoxyribonuclease V alpha subunit